jgi:hypothetical protein
MCKSTRAAQAVREEEHCDAIIVDGPPAIIVAADRHPDVAVIAAAAADPLSRLCRCRCLLLFFRKVALQVRPSRLGRHVFERRLYNLPLAGEKVVVVRLARFKQRGQDDGTIIMFRRRILRSFIEVQK